MSLSKRLLRFSDWLKLAEIKFSFQFAFLLPGSSTRTPPYVTSVNGPPPSTLNVAAEHSDCHSLGLSVSVSTQDNHLTGFVGNSKLINFYFDTSKIKYQPALFGRLCFHPCHLGKGGGRLRRKLCVHVHFGQLIIGTYTRPLCCY